MADKPSFMRATLTRMLSTALRSKYWRAHELPVVADAPHIQHLLQHGWAIVPNVLTPAECTAIANSLTVAKARIASAASPWTTEPGAAAVQAAWDVRQHANVTATFAQLWQTSDLVVSTEGWLVEQAAKQGLVTSMPLLYEAEAEAKTRVEHWGSWTAPHIALSTSRLAAGEVCVRGLVTTTPCQRLCVLDGSHKYIAACLTAFGVNTGSMDWHELSEAQLAWLQDYVGEDDDNENVHVARRPRSTRVYVDAPQGSMLLYFAHTVTGLAPSRGSPQPTCLVPVCYAPRAWAQPADLASRRALFAGNATTDAWPLFHTRVLSMALDAPRPALSPAGLRLAGWDKALPSNDILDALARTAKAPAAAVAHKTGAVVRPRGTTQQMESTPPRPLPLPASFAASSPNRVGLRLTNKRMVRVGSDAVKTIVINALRSDNTVLTLLEPDSGTGAYMCHTVATLGLSEREAAMQRVAIGWVAEMMVADTEDIALGRSAPHSIVVKWKGGKAHREIPVAPRGSRAAALACEIQACLAGIPDMAPPRRLRVCAYANDSIIVTVAPWEHAAVEAALAHMRVAGTTICVRKSDALPDMWDLPLPPLVAGVLAVEQFLATSSKWRVGSAFMHVTVGTVLAEDRAAQEGWTADAGVLIVCQGCMSYVYDALEQEAQACVPASTVVRVGWDGKDKQTFEGLKC